MQRVAAGALQRAARAVALQGEGSSSRQQPWRACTCAFSSTPAGRSSSSSAVDANHPSPSIELDSPAHNLAKQPFSASSDTPQASTSASASKPAVSHDTRSALSLLRSQPSHYIVASIYRRRFLLTPTDLLTVPRLKDVQVGDVIQLDKIHELGSRDYTMQASEAEVLPAEVVSCQATVVEHTQGRMEEIVKFKRRKGYQKTIKHKSRYTRLRIGEIKLGQEQ